MDQHRAQRSSYSMNFYGWSLFFSDISKSRVEKFQSSVAFLFFLIIFTYSNHSTHFSPMRELFHLYPGVKIHP